jgi:hypothetical protein
MKRIALLSILALAVAAATVASNAVGAPDTAGPKCADITDGQGGYAYYQNNDDQAPPLANPYFDFSITLASAACKSVTYTLWVSLNNGTPYAVQATGSGTTVTFPTQTFDQATAPQSVCVYAETSMGGHVADRAPDPGSGCNSYNRNDFGGTLFH